MGKLYLVQIKSDSIQNDGGNALLIPMEMEKEGLKGITTKEIHDALIRDSIKLYPQYTKKEDNPIFTISRMSKKEYKDWRRTNVFRQKSLARSVK